jgi:phospholipid N-methyltransferase
MGYKMHDRTKKTDRWGTSNNIDFYENLSPQRLIEASESVGLDTCCDLKLIEPYIGNTSSILEVGSGYGRVVSYVLDAGYRGEFYAIERSKTFFNYLQKKFSSDVNLINGDIVDYPFTRKFDLILWLWAGFIEFSTKEQKSLFTKLSSLLNLGGIVIIDVVPTSFSPPNSKTIDEQHYVVHLPPTKASCYCYVPSIYDFLYYAASSCLEYSQSKLYVTPKNRQRILQVFTKKERSLKDVFKVVKMPI